MLLFFSQSVCILLHFRDQLVNPATPAPRACLVWRAGRDLLDLLDLLVLLVTQFRWLLQLSLAGRRPLVFPELRAQWEPRDLQEREELVEREDLVEEEESPAWRALLELLEGRDYLEDRAILGTLESLDGP